MEMLEELELLFCVKLSIYASRACAKYANSPNINRNPGSRTTETPPNLLKTFIFQQCITLPIHGQLALNPKFVCKLYTFVLSKTFRRSLCGPQASNSS
jgi:hypothetical protein